VLDRIAFGARLLRREHQPHRCLGDGTRNVRKAILRALLEPGARLADAEGDGTHGPPPMFEEQKSCRGLRVGILLREAGRPPGLGWLDASNYERDV